MQRSDEHSWDVERAESFFDPVGGHYDVRRAKQLIVASPREVKQWPTTGSHRELLDDAIESTREKVGLDPATIDDSLPLIVTVEPGGGTIIDGHHRLRKRLARGALTVPIVVLSQGETALIRRPHGGPPEGTV